MNYIFDYKRLFFQDGNFPLCQTALKHFNLHYFFRKNKKLNKKHASQTNISSHWFQANHYVFKRHYCDILINETVLFKRSFITIRIVIVIGLLFAFRSSRISTMFLSITNNYLAG